MKRSSYVIIESDKEVYEVIHDNVDKERSRGNFLVICHWSVCLVDIV